MAKWVPPIAQLTLWNEGTSIYITAHILVRSTVTILAFPPNLTSITRWNSTLAKFVTPFTCITTVNNTANRVFPAVVISRIAHTSLLVDTPLHVLRAICLVVNIDYTSAFNSIEDPPDATFNLIALAEIVVPICASYA